jgi:hypothetical protein
MDGGLPIGVVNRVTTKRPDQQQLSRKQQGSMSHQINGKKLSSNNDAGPDFERIVQVQFE